MSRSPARPQGSGAPKRKIGPAGRSPGPARKSPAGGAARRNKDAYATVSAYVAIGANLGDAAANVRAAMESLAGLHRTVVTARSSLYRSPPMGEGADGPEYVNAVVALRTGLDAEQLLAALQRLETDAGRERSVPNAPRTLDLDLLMFANTVRNTPELTLPHPRMRERAFVLKPLAEIAPDKVPAAALARVADQGVQRIR